MGTVVSSSCFVSTPLFSLGRGLLPLPLLLWGPSHGGQCSTDFSSVGLSQGHISSHSAAAWVPSMAAVLQEQAAPAWVRPVRNPALA